jgi:hypothetical protein
VASFLTAMKTDSWRRSGGPQDASWKFVAAQDGRPARGNLAYVEASNAKLDAVPNAIRLAYEDLCDPTYGSHELDDFFGRPVRIENPKPATSGAAYVENWEEFCAFLGQRSAPVA